MRRIYILYSCVSRQNSRDGIDMERPLFFYYVILLLLLFTK